jgi:RNA polymerase sigma-70 factor (ECF subfamily)
MTRDGVGNEIPTLLPRLWRFALRLTGDRHDAEDLVQRACVRALERQHQFRPGTSTLSWLFSIVYSIWLNEVRAQQTRLHGRIHWSEELVETVPDPTSPSPETYTLHRQIINAVERLPDAQRAVMLLVAVEGLSYREAAVALDVPVGTVMSRLARARQTIGELFDARQRDEPRESEAEPARASYGRLRPRG